MVKEIALQNGIVALVDDEDFERVNQYIWSINLSNRKTNRVVRNRTLNITLQRFILGEEIPLSHTIIFVNKDDLDFRKENLLIASAKGMSVRKKGNKNSSSIYKGVSWCNRSSKWLAQIQVNGKSYHLGYFTNEEKAALAYNEGSKFHFGEDAFQNEIGEINASADYELQVAKKPRTTLNPTSIFRGVSFNKASNMYIAQTKFKGKNFSMGLFFDEVEAAKAYDQKSYELRGDKAILNFPELVDEYKVMK